MMARKQTRSEAAPDAAALPSNDVLICLRALKSGAAVLTANVGEFDLIQQLVPSAEIIYYAV